MGRQLTSATFWAKIPLLRVSSAGLAYTLLWSALNWCHWAWRRVEAVAEARRLNRMVECILARLRAHWRALGRGGQITGLAASQCARH